jgi:uncharacterized protein YqgC (DUF456 family)
VLLLFVISIILIFIGALGAVYPALPGAPVALIGFFLLAWESDFQKVGYLTLIILTILTIISFLLDTFASIFGAKILRASKYGILGVTIGTIIGIFMGPIGIFAGPFLGALIGEVYNGTSLLKSGTVAVGTLISTVIAIAIKVSLMASMIACFAFAYFFAT